MNEPQDSLAATSIEALVRPFERSDAQVGAHVAGNPESTLVRQLWQIVVRRKWIIIGSVLAALGVGLILSMLAQRMYSASATVEIAREDAKILNIQGVRDKEVGGAPQEFYQTQYGLLKSHTLADRIVRDNNLIADPQFQTAFHFGEKPASGTDVRAAQEARLEAARAILLAHVTVAPVRDSRLVEIHFTSPNPELSARIANAWAEGFIKWNIQRGFDETQFARAYLEQRLESTKLKLEESERAAVDYASREGVFRIDSPSGDGKATTSQSVPQLQVTTFNDELSKATAERIAAEAAYRNSAGADNTNANSTLLALRQKRAEASADYRRLSAQFDSHYPAVEALSRQIGEYDRAIGAEQVAIHSQVHADLAARYRAAVDRESMLRQQVAEATAHLLDDKRLNIQYNIYQRDADTNRQLYDALLQRYKEVGVASGADRTNVAVVDRADVPHSPSAPNVLVYIVVSGFLGMLIGLAVVVVVEQVEDVVNDPTTIEAKLGVPLLGTLPPVEREYDLPVAALRDPKSSLTEAYLSLRTALQFSTAHGLPRTLSITSSQPSEGKSVTALAIALQLASSGQSVLLIDCDMRKPSVHKTLNLNNTRGLSNVLSGQTDPEELIVRDQLDAIDVLVAGPTPPNAAELLASDRLRQVLAALLERYDYIICDGPPVVSLADAPILATNVEATLFVVEAHRTHIAEIRRAIGRLGAVSCRIVGIAMTKYESNRSAYSYEYGYGYGREARGE